MVSLRKTSTFLALIVASILSLNTGANDKKNEKNKNEQNCGTRVLCIIAKPPYRSLYKGLTRNGNIAALTKLVNRLESTSSLAAYDALLQKAYDIVNEYNGSVVLTPVTEPDMGNALDVISPRVLIAENDGTVIVDTAAFTGTGPYYRKSTLYNWQNKLVNENHNSRVAVFDCQLWPCGVGAETKFSSSVKVDQNYAAHRLGGGYLKSSGTARLSANAK